MKVSLFITCLVDQFFPNVGISMVRLLRQQGIEVDFPTVQTCCGQPAFNSGHTEEARQVAKTILDAFEDADYVVTPSGSCAGMIHHYYPYLFQDDKRERKRVETLIEKTYEFSQFLVNVVKVRDLQGSFPYRVTYHPSCHGSRLLGIQEEPLLLLQQLKGIELIPLPNQEDCCGFGGTFSVKMSGLSSAMVKEKCDWILTTKAEVLVGTDMGCLMNIEGNLRQRQESIRVLHLAEILDEGVSAHANENRSAPSQAK